MLLFLQLAWCLTGFAVLVQGDESSVAIASDLAGLVCLGAVSLCAMYALSILSRFERLQAQAPGLYLAWCLSILTTLTKLIAAPERRPDVDHFWLTYALMFAAINSALAFVLFLPYCSRLQCLEYCSRVISGPPVH
jgi:hypothetical protein